MSSEPLSSRTTLDRARRPVTFLVPTLEPGGAERYTVTLANALAARGWDVDICTTYDTDGLYRSDIGGGVRFYALGLRSRLDFMPFTKYLRENRPRLVVCIMHAAACYAIVARTLSGTRTPLVAFEGGLNLTATRTDWRQHARLKLELSVIYRYPSQIIAVAPGIADELVGQAHIPRERITVIDTPSAVPVFADARMRGAAPEDWPSKPVIATISRLDSNKDVATLVRAFAIVRRTRPVALAIIGKGPERAALEALAHTLGVAPDVHFVGTIEKPWRALRHAAVYVNSSITEGLSNALIEAMAVGCPVVATDAPGGNAHILRQGRVGPLVPVADAEAMARAIVAMLDAPTAAETLIGRAHDFGERTIDAHIALLTRSADIRGFKPGD